MCVWAEDLSSHLLVGSQFFFATNCVLFWALAHYYHPTCFIRHSTLGRPVRSARADQVWTLANYLLTTREAKRIFGMVGGGAIWCDFRRLLVEDGSQGIPVRKSMLGMTLLLLICAGADGNRMAGLEIPACRFGETALEIRNRAKGPAGQHALGSFLPYLRAISRSPSALLRLSHAYPAGQLKLLLKQFLVNKDALAILFGNSISTPGYWDCCFSCC